MLYKIICLKKCKTIVKLTQEKNTGLIKSIKGIIEHKSSHKGYYKSTCWNGKHGQVNNIC